MLDSIRLKFTENPSLELPIRGITIFVGPNNSGKSLILKEIERAFLTYPFPNDLNILEKFEITWPNSDDEIKYLLDGFKKFQRKDLGSDQFVFGRINPNSGFESTIIHQPHIYREGRNKTNKSWWAAHVLRWQLLRLDGRSRFNLTNDQSGGDLLATPNNNLTLLFQDDEARKRVRDFIKDAFGVNFVIDPTNLGTLRIRLSEQNPLTNEQSLNQEAREYFSNAKHIKDASDGVQAYTGIVTAAISGEFHTILIDEPEAFLHPPLARKLGKHLGSLATERGASLLASTHSSDFLMGCIQSTKNVRVIRMEYSNGKSRGRMVEPTELESMFRKPLMRSTNAIEALFYDGVVVTESDNDRAFYAEIYHRISEDTEGCPSILFINAQNKQTIKDILGPLRKFGVPAAAIPDIDIVKDGGKTWNDWLSAARIPDALHEGYQNQRNTIKMRLDATHKEMKNGGIDILSPSDKEAAKVLFEQLKNYGIFVVQGGELENWLQTLSVPGKKTQWTVAMLERLGSDPEDSNYISPGTNDVWEFIRGIIEWIKDSTRKGTD